MAHEFTEDSVGDSSRRLSARPRKLTAKAQALSGSRFLPRESANIPLSTKSADSRPGSPYSAMSDFGIVSKILATSHGEQTPSARTGSTYSRSDVDPQTSIGTELRNEEINIDEVRKRYSRRERKASAKALGPEPVQKITALSRKRSEPPSEEEPRYKMREKRKLSAKALATELTGPLDAYLDEGFNSDAIQPQQGRRRSALQKSTSDLEMPPSRARRISSAKGNETPLISNTPRVKTGKRVTRTEDSGVGLGKSSRAQGSPKKAGSPRLSEPSVGARSPAASMSSQTPRKYAKQRTKGRKRAGSAPARPSKTYSQIEDLDHVHSATGKKHPKQCAKRGKRHTAALATRTNKPDLAGPDTPATRTRIILSHKTPVEKSTGSDPLPNSQQRLILTLPLPTSSSKSAPSFPAQVRKAEFVDKGCQLFCLDAASRILAFAEIAAELPESDEYEGHDAGTADSRLYEKWLELGRSRFCVCGKSDTSAVRSVLTEDELTQFLEPNAVRKLKAKKKTHGSSAKSPPTMSFPRVNTIVKASEGRRVSALYNQVIVGSAPSRHSIHQQPGSAAPLQADPSTVVPEAAPAVAPAVAPAPASRRAQPKGHRKPFGMFGPESDQDGLREGRNLPEQVLVCL